LLVNISAEAASMVRQVVFMRRLQGTTADAVRRSVAVNGKCQFRMTASEATDLRAALNAETEALRPSGSATARLLAGAAADITAALLAVHP
jgi:hypothetical protein